MLSGRNADLLAKFTAAVRVCVELHESGERDRVQAVHRKMAMPSAQWMMTATASSTPKTRIGSVPKTGADAKKAPAHA